MIERILSKEQLNKADIVRLLALDDFGPVYEKADEVRREAVGDTVHLRAIIEFSNICKRQCLYCGLNRENKSLPRFRMSHEEIISVAQSAVSAGYRTIVLQSGEDDYFTAERLGRIVEDIKALEVPAPAEINGSLTDIGTDSSAHLEKDSADKRTEVSPAGEMIHPAVTLSCGELSEETLKYLKEKGADRYLLKHETADSQLYDRLHPCGTLESRLYSLTTMHKLGYETGSGFMVGLPGQTLEMLAEDLLLLKKIPCDMAGIGPFISNPKTRLGGEKNGDPELTRRCVAIARLLLPEANLPLTTALSVADSAAANNAEPRQDDREKSSKGGQNGDRLAESDRGCGTRENPFSFGANVIMKKVTPDEYKEAYEIYPAEYRKTNVLHDRRELEWLIRSFDRVPL